MLTNPPVPYDLCIGILVTFALAPYRGLTPMNNVVNVKALIGAFNKVVAFSMIVKTNGSFAALCCAAAASDFCQGVFSGKL